MSSNARVTTHYQKLCNATIFYRTAGSPTKPTLLLLHGFPTSSHYFRNIIPVLAASDIYHIIAPDFPGSGFTSVEPGYKYTFESLAKTLGEFLNALAMNNFAMYIFDYGVLIGLRLVLERPKAVTALITQNGNAYLEGLGDILAPITNYWKSRSQADRDIVRQGMLTYIATKWGYTDGTPNPEAIAPESWTLDYALLSSDQEIHLDLLKDYETNVELYPNFQRWFRESQIPTLVAWGKNDQHFVRLVGRLSRKICLVLRFICWMQAILLVRRTRRNWAN